MPALFARGFHHPPTPSSEEEGEHIALKSPLLFRGGGWGWWISSATFTLFQAQS